MPPAPGRIIEFVKTRIPRQFGFDRDIQVLCPTNRGGVSARSLNSELRQRSILPVIEAGVGRQHPGRMILSQCGNWRWRNDAVGHSRRFRRRATMSALTPITTKPATHHNGRKGQERHFTPRTRASRLDHSVGRAATQWLQPQCSVLANTLPRATRLTNPANDPPLH